MDNKIDTELKVQAEAWIESFQTSRYALRDKYMADEKESIGEKFYITGFDLLQAYLAGALSTEK